MGPHSVTLRKADFLTVIPARGGSKGVPRKNLRSVAGRPLIDWTIQAALDSDVVKHLVVTTDDVEIAAHAARRGLDVTMRPAELAADDTPMVATVRHALSETETRLRRQFSAVILLQPTSPLRTGTDIAESIAMFERSAADSVVSVYRAETCHPAKMYTIQDGTLRPVWHETESTNRQDLPAVYHRNGAIFIATRTVVLSSPRMWGGRMVPYEMPASRSTDVDREDDIAAVERLLGIQAAR